MQAVNNTQSLIKIYNAHIDEIVSECEHTYRLTIDYDLLDTKIDELFEMAQNDGLSESDLWELVQKRIPTYINYKNFKSASKKAA